MIGKAKKRTLGQILKGESTVVNRTAPKTKPSAMPRKVSPGKPKRMKGNTFGVGWGG